MESRGSGATAAGQRLLQAETSENRLPVVSSGQGGRVLRWFTTMVLNAAFLGMVRAQALTPPGWGAGLGQGSHPSRETCF